MKSGKTRRRIARSDVLCWLSTFVILQVGLAFALDFKLSVIRDPNCATRENLLRAAVANHPRQPLVIVLGTSRCLHGLRPDMLTDSSGDDLSRPVVFNFSQPGFGPTHSYVALKHLLRDGFRPEAIVLELVPAQLGMNLSQIDYLDATRLNLRELGDYAVFRDRPGDVYRQWYEARALPAFSFRFRVMERILPRWIPPNKSLTGWRGLDANGWLPLYWNTPSAQALEEAQKNLAPFLRNFRIAPDNERAIRMIVELCRTRRISLTVLFAPEGPAFRSWYTPEAIAGMRQLIDWLRHDQGVPVVDARDWIESEALFWDSHHLVPKGAEVFTHQLSRELMPRFASLRGPKIAAKK
jgi:hypothetical protein